MVIQMSLMEERARQEAEAKESGDAAGESATVPPIPEVEMSEDDLIQQALALSVMDNAEVDSTVPGNCE